MLHRENQIRQYHDGSVADLMNFFILTQTPIEKKGPAELSPGGSGELFGLLYYL